MPTPGSDVYGAAAGRLARRVSGRRDAAAVVISGIRSTKVLYGVCVSFVHTAVYL